MRRDPLAQVCALLSAVLMLLVLSDVGRAQSSVRAWGGLGYDTEGRTGRFARVSMGVESMAVLRSDGRIFVNGITGYFNDRPPRLATGLNYIDVGIARSGGCGVVSDGTMRVWGKYSLSQPIYFDSYPPPPTLPAGVRYVQADIGATVVALRSDGQIEVWGDPSVVTPSQLTVPAFPPGAIAVKVVAASEANFALMSDGTIMGWGQHRAFPVPPPPVGTAYVDFSVSRNGNPAYGHAAAVLSDGNAMCWGDNTWGQCNVPPLPLGVTYKHVAAADSASVAVRSDGVLLGWGPQGHDLLPPPSIPTDFRVVQLDSGTLSAVALLSDGSTFTWGSNSLYGSAISGLDLHDRFFGVSRGSMHTVAVTHRHGVIAWGGDFQGSTNVPVELTRGGITSVSAGDGFGSALHDDGSLTMWGWNVAGQCNVPPLPPGVRYRQAAHGWKHSIAIRSDGQAVAWGDPLFGATTVPPLPAGLQYVACDAINRKNLLLRSDGHIEVFGDNYGTPSQMIEPTAPAGLQFVGMSAALTWNIAILSDGTATWWGGVGGTGTIFWVPLSSLSLPFGVYYVEVDCGADFALLRRSDGLIDVCGNAYVVGIVPELDPGTSYVEVSAARDLTATARIGPTQTYVSFAHGCAGSMPASRLVPRDTPRIGKTLEVRLFDLPANIALMTMGLSPLPSPITLDSIGMPGCTAEVTIDGVLPLVGQGNQAVWSLPIPNIRSLIGLHFYNQAIVLDPTANALGLVTSDAAEGVVGDW